MSIGFATVLSLSANVTLAVFGSALVFLVLWQDLRRRSNLYFAVCMAIFAAYGALNTVFQVAQQAGLEPEPVLQILTTLYVAGLILLFSFVLAFAGMPRPDRWKERAVSVPLGLFGIALVWAGRVYVDFEPQASGNYHYTITTVGKVLVGFVIIYLAGIVVRMRRLNTPRARELVLPLAILVLGAFAFSLTPEMRRFSLNAVAVTVAVVMLGRIVLKYQVFQPLADLNAELDRKIQELYEATQAKSRFLANMSHELRTPLNSIIGYTELVTKGTYGTLSELQHDRLSKVGRNGRTLLELINDVLDLSRIEAGRLILSLETVSTAELLDSLMDEFRPQAEQKGLSLVRGYGHLPALHADITRARHILSNLLSNAIKFTDQGAVIVRGHFDPGSQRVVITITDTGPGIPPDRHDRLFDAYLDSESLLTRQREGTGLGLAIAYRLTEMHNGHLWFESTPGQGTTFHVALPVVQATVAEGFILEPKNRKGPVIVAIDDDQDALEVMQGYLEAARFSVYGACNANDGLKLAHDLHPVLITLDLLMPNIDGWQMLESLRRDPVTATIPVLLVSAIDDSERARTAGADGFMRKPAPEGMLLSEVRRLVTGTGRVVENRQEADA